MAAYIKITTSIHPGFAEAIIIDDIERGFDRFRKQKLPDAELRRRCTFRRGELTAEQVKLEVDVILPTEHPANDTGHRIDFGIDCIDNYNFLAKE